MSEPEDLKVDVSLVKQLDQAAPDEPVEAVFRLQSKGPKPVPAPDETLRLAAELIQRAETAAGAKAHRSNVFKHMGSFVVSARPTIIRELLKQPEVIKATANRQGV